MSFDLFQEEGGTEHAHESGATIALRIYEREDVLLSDLLPVLEHFGLLISSQYETKVYLAGGRVYSMDTFLRVTNAVPALKRRMMTQDAALRDHVDSADEVVHAG